MERRGTVIKSTGSWYEVLTDEKQVFKCRLRGKFKQDDLKVTNPIAVGDHVTFEHSSQENDGVIYQILPRENYIIRKSTRKTGHGHIIAANIDQAVLVVTLVFPKTSLGFIDRFLVSSESFRIPAILVFNKVDMLNEDLLNIQNDLRDMYAKAGYESFAISATEQIGLDALVEKLKGRTSLFSGHSGVGKSTLMNILIPHANQKTAVVSDYANKGVHTTTFAELFIMNESTYIIDTPGIKELGLVDIENEELSHYFPELRELLGTCKYYNCTHTHEPGCAIIEAFNKGKVSASRYESYLSILEDDDNRR